MIIKELQEKEKLEMLFISLLLDVLSMEWIATTLSINAE